MKLLAYDLRSTPFVTAVEYTQGRKRTWKNPPTESRALLEVELKHKVNLDIVEQAARHVNFRKWEQSRGNAICFQESKQSEEYPGWHIAVQNTNGKKPCLVRVVHYTDNEGSLSGVQREKIHEFICQINRLAVAEEKKRTLKVE